MDIKYKYKQLKDLLLNIQEHDEEKQRQVIKETFITWKGKLEQEDDVCVFGLKI